MHLDNQELLKSLKCFECSEGIKNAVHSTLIKEKSLFTVLGNRYDQSWLLTD